MIKEKLLTMNRPKTKLIPEGVVIHSTANKSGTADNHYNYFNSAYRGASAHYFVDATEILRIIPEDEVAWHAGKTANHKYLSVEMCEVEPFEKVWANTVWLVADMCKRYKWTTGPNVFSHRWMSQLYKETNHDDPHDFLERNGKSWDELLEAIDKELSPKIDPDMYLGVKVRTSKADNLVKQIIDMGYACSKLNLP